MLGIALTSACGLLLTLAQANALRLDPPLSLLGYPDCTLEEGAPGLNIFRFARCQQRASVAQSVKVACVGDSITAGAHATGADKTYPAVLQGLLDKQSPGEYEVTNLGAGGATLQRDGDSPYWQRPQFQALIQHKWDIVIVMLGTNDAKDEGDGGPPNWIADCGGGTELVECKYALEYKALVEVVRSLGPGATPPTIYTMVPPPLMQAGAIGANQTVINSVYPMLVPLFTESMVGVKGPVDVFNALGGVAHWRKSFPEGGCGPGADWTPCELYCGPELADCDQCHPSDAGYARIAHTVMEEVFGSPHKTAGAASDALIALEQ